MILVMKSEATKEDIEYVVKQIKDWGHDKIVINQGETQTIIGIIGEKSELQGKPLTALRGIQKVVEVSAPYKKASREFKPNSTIIDINGVKIGGGYKQIIAGPCSVDKEDIVIGIAKAIKASGATMLRGGAYKPRTSPYTFQGHGEDGLKMLQTAKEETGLPIVTELMSSRDIDLVYKYADVIQIGARNMQNFPLLKEIGTLGKPVILKNGIASTAKEHLMSAEYILSGGLDDVILCLRGVRSYEDSMRNSLDLSLVPYLQTKTHLPVIVDSSHAVGKHEYVNALAYAGMAIGADGLILEVHPCPACALSDGEQALLPEDFEYLMRSLDKLVAWEQSSWKNMSKQIKHDCQCK